MIAALLLMAAAVPQDCGMLQGTVAQDTCWLAQSMAMDPPPDCKNPQTQSDMNVCSYRDYLRADIALNQAWGKVVTKASGSGLTGDLARHRDAQRKWVAFRDAQCLAENGPREESGTIWPLLQNTCLEHLTDARTKQLRAYLETEN